MQAVIFNYKVWINKVEPEILVPAMNDILQKAEYHVLNFIDHNFTPQGHTSLWLLAESHLAIHTFPEEQKAYIELSSCSEKKNEIFVAQIQKWIQRNSIVSSNEIVQTVKP